MGRDRDDAIGREEDTMIKAIDITVELAGLAPLRGRRPDTPAEEVRGAFAALAPFRDGSIFAGRFSGSTAWERHRNGDEIVHVLDGAATLTIMTDTGPQSFRLTAGLLIVVPQGHWHRLDAPDGVTVLSATPQPTDHTAEMDPRDGVR
ncbi:MAG TPA: cupin domain-containing protein [Candidatus Nitrosotalea sp.]|nr:cupin domain-containing protein [Candidatus Nitrosotalea sp.]